MSVFIDIKTGEKVVIIELINNTFGSFAKVKCKITYNKHL